MIDKRTFSKWDVQDIVYNVFETYDLPNSPKFGERFEAWLNDKWLNGNNWQMDHRLWDFHEAEVESFICWWLWIADAMESLILKIESSIDKLRNRVSKEDRDNLEFDLNDLNICISGMEYDYDCNVIALDKLIDEEYKAKVNEITVDAVMNKYLKSKFIDHQLTLNKNKATLKRWKNLYKWFIKTAKHIESNQIQANVDAKRQQSFT